MCVAPAVANWFICPHSRQFRGPRQRRRPAARGRRSMLFFGSGTGQRDFRLPATRRGPYGPTEDAAADTRAKTATENRMAMILRTIKSYESLSDIL
jgi:hypothetical protein